MAVRAVIFGAALPAAASCSVSKASCSSSAALPSSSSITGTRLNVRKTIDGTPQLYRLGRGKVVMTATLPPKAKDVGIYVPRELHAQVTHSITEERLQVVKSLDSWAEQSLLPYLKPVEKCWQPQDHLPDSSSDGFYDEVKELRARAAELPDDYLVVLVGDMITEEALPTYQTMLNTLDGTKDETGASLTPWGVWTRAWTAEENRHGDLLNKYLYLTGRVNMRSIEKTVQYLVGSGMPFQVGLTSLGLEDLEADNEAEFPFGIDECSQFFPWSTSPITNPFVLVVTREQDPQTENNPYLGFVYTSFQERATFVSHGNTARHAKGYGNDKLATICGLIAADERRHENAYAKIVEKLFEVDPDGAMQAFGDMMRKKIAMPAHLMFDGKDQDLFNRFSMVAQRTGTYTAKDYADILEHLVNRWNVEKITGLSGEGRKAQDFVCTLAHRIRKLEERAASKAKKTPQTGQFSWIFDREVLLW